jgi:hypothetical protein
MSTYVECIAIHRRAWYQKQQPTNCVVFLCVIIPHRLATDRLWALSAVGSACDSHSQGQAFDSPSVHVILLIFLLNFCRRIAASELDRPHTVPGFAFCYSTWHRHTEMPHTSTFHAGVSPRACCRCINAGVAKWIPYFHISIPTLLG